MKNKSILLLFVLTVIGGIIRLGNLGINPPELNVDEVSIGYNAYSILKTGKDEYGNFLPLSIKSLGDYKPPVYIYLASVSEAIWGLNEFAVRFPSAFFGTLSIPLFYLFIRKLIKDEKVALLSAGLFTFSPWNIYFSRIASEAQVANFLLLTGSLCLLKFLQGSKLWGYVGALFLALSMETYHTERVFVPLVIMILLVLNRRQVFQNKFKYLNFLLFFGLLSLPLFYSMFFGMDKTRAQMTIIAFDPNLRNLFTSKVAGLSGLPMFFSSIFDWNYLLMLFYWIRKFLAYFQPSFLFFDGLSMTQKGTYGLGLMYFFEIPWLVLGVITLTRRKMENKRLIFGWVVAGILPASLTMDEHHMIRTLVVLPMTLLLSGLGAVVFFKWVKDKFSFWQMKLFSAIYGLFIIWNLVWAFLVFGVHFPSQTSESFMVGTKEAVTYAIEHKDQYREIVFDPVRGVEGPYIVSVPHVYILFYSKYDPEKYLSETKRQEDDIYGFDKFTIRPIDWRSDIYKEDTLFIGSPWSLPLQDVKEEDILKKIYLQNGNLALLVVTSHSAKKPILLQE
jgi:4-amino-4-deoxy-L-arabinose transferase-like glycosyltransferase